MFFAVLRGLRCLVERALQRHVVPGTLAVSRRVMAAVALITIGALATASPGQGDKSRGGALGRKPVQVRWQLLERLPAEESREVTKIRIVMFKRERTGFQDYLAREERFDTEITDPLVLDMMPIFLSWALRGAAIADAPHNDEPCGYGLGELHISRIDGDFMIGITTVGFALQSRIPTLRNTFYSCGVAKLVDHILVRHRQPGLHANLVSRLSPCGAAELEMRYFEKMQARYRQDIGTKEENGKRGS